MTVSGDNKKKTFTDSSFFLDYVTCWVAKFTNRTSDSVTLSTQCKSCKIKIPKGKDIGHKCEVCSKHATKQEGRDKIVEYAKFNHRDDVVEYVVLICDPKIKKKSNLDLDKKYGQDFPLIHS